MIWFISLELINICASSPQKKGYICLYNKNRMRNNYFKIIKQDPNKLGYIIERKTIPKYWKQVIIEHKTK